MAKKLSVCHEIAYLDYLALGLDRSLGKLHKKYTATTPNPPSIDTLKQWSSRFRWHSRIYHDSLKVSEEVRSRAAQEKGAHLAAIQQDMRTSAHKILSDLFDQNGPEKGSTLTESRTAYYQVKAAVEMINLAEALPGGSFYKLIPDEWNERKKFLTAMKLPKHLSEKTKEKLSYL